MGSILSSVTGGGQQQSQGMQPHAMEQISNPMGPQAQAGSPMQSFNAPTQQPQNFGSNPTNALSNIGRRF